MGLSRLKYSSYRLGVCKGRFLLRPILSRKLFGRRLTRIDADKNELDWYSLIGEIRVHPRLVRFRPQNLAALNESEVELLLKNQWIAADVERT